MNEWKEALRLLRATAVEPEGSAARSRAAARAQAFLASCADAHLARLAPIVIPQVSDRRLLCALVPAERRASRERLSDADIGVANTDPPEPPPGAPLPLAVVADNLRSALNIGGVLRTCAFFGASELWLCGYSATPDDSPQVLKSAMGAERAIAWRRADGAAEALADLRARGFRTYALETMRGALDATLWTPCRREKCAFVIGNERFGLDPKTVALCDGALAIRGGGAKNSLNAVCALAIALFAASRADDRRAPPDGGRGLVLGAGFEPA